MSALRIGRVVNAHPEDHSVDVYMVDNGERFYGVQALAGSASGSTGANDLPQPELPPSGDPWDTTARTERDIYALVGFVGRAPVVMGFLYPQVSQMLFADMNRRVHRHVSDWYTSVDDSGNFEAYHPSGTYFRIGTSPAHEDLTGKDFDGRWKISRNTASAVHVHLGVSNAGAQVASLDIDPSGNLAVSHNGNLSVTTGGTADVTVAGSATVKAPSVTVDSPNSTFTGKVTVQGLLTYQDGIAGQAGTNGSNISGTLSIANGDVVADTVGLKSHTHTDPQGGTVGPATG